MTQAFGPESFSTLQRAVKDEVAQPSLGLLTKLLRLSQLDPDVFMKFKGALVQQVGWRAGIGSGRRGSVAANLLKMGNASGSVVALDGWLCGCIGVAVCLERPASSQTGDVDKRCSYSRLHHDHVLHSIDLSYLQRRCRGRMNTPCRSRKYLSSGGQAGGFFFTVPSRMSRGWFRFKIFVIACL